MSKINCTNCNQDKFLKIPLVSLANEDTEKLCLDNLKDIPSGFYYVCAGCNKPLTEGPLNKPILRLIKVGCYTHKIKEAGKAHSEYKDAVCFLMSHKKDTDYLQEIIGDPGAIGERPQWQLIRDLVDVESIKEKYIFVTKFDEKLFLNHPRNYIVCLTHKEYDQLELDAFVLDAKFSGVYNFQEFES